MATEDFKRKLTAVFSADVAGYSRLMAEDETATVKTLATYREVMASLIKQHRGRVVDSPGDNVLAEFASVVDAVQCAVAVQKEFHARNAELPENRRMVFRIGINLGDVIEEEDRIYGDGVNIAARLEALAEPGGICISKTAFDQIETKLPLGYEYLGEQEVKNITKPVGAYRVLMEPRVTVAEEIEKEKAVPVWRRKAMLAGGIVAVLVVIALLIWNHYLQHPPVEPASVDRMAFPLPEKPSIAVLPFVNMSEDHKQEYFSDGLTEEIITALSKVPKLFVIARNSAFAYKGKSVKVQQVAEELGVRYLLEGSVRKSGDKVRITAQLIDAVKGHHLWAEKYDRNLKDIFALQDEITLKILTALRMKLARGDAERLYAKGTKNLEAYLKCLQARELISGAVSKEKSVLARRLAQEAIHLDPNYSEAYRELAATYVLDVYLGMSKSPRESLRRAVELSQKAIALDNSNAHAHSLLAVIYLMLRQHDKAVAAVERAYELEPNSPQVLYRYGHVLWAVGRWEEALPFYEEAMRLNPIPPNILLRRYGALLRELERYDEAIAVLKKAIEQEPKRNLFAYLMLAVTYCLAGREEEARDTAKEVLRINPKFSVKYMEKTIPFKNRAHTARLTTAMRKAGLPEKPPLPLPDKPSIAVLPFVNMSGDPEQEYFSDGITEEIITALSKTPKLFVIARNSTFTYKGKSVKVQQVGRELGVKYVLEGSVRKAGDKVRITAQLVDAKTGHHLWAERYDRELKDIFAVQDEITMKIITAMGVNLTAGEQARLSAKGTDNLDAYLKYLEGREHVFRFNKDDNLLARQRAEEAMALDLEYSNAYALLGKTHILDVWFKWSKSPKESLARAFELAKKALVLDESNIGAHRVLSHIYLLKRQHDKAIVESERAVSFAPNAADEIYNLGLILRFSGRAKEAISMHEKAIRLNPMPPASYLYQLALSYTFIGEFEKAIDICKKALHQNPDDLVGRITLAIAYSSLGREEEARAEAAEVLRIHPKFSVEYASKTWPYKNQADRDLVLNALRKAGLK